MLSYLFSELFSSFKELFNKLIDLEYSNQRISNIVILYKKMLSELFSELFSSLMNCLIINRTFKSTYLQIERISCITSN